jgi:hypothetical protein
MWFIAVRLNHWMSPVNNLQHIVVSKFRTDVIFLQRYLRKAKQAISSRNAVHGLS